MGGQKVMGSGYGSNTSGKVFAGMCLKTDVHGDGYEEDTITSRPQYIHAVNGLSISFKFVLSLSSDAEQLT